MRHLSWSNTGNCVVKTCSPKFNLCVWFITHLNICVCSPRNSPWQLVIAECFAKVSSVFYSNHLGKIYIQFIIFSTYFSTKLWFKNKKYHLHVLEKCLCYKKSDQLYFRQFIYPLSLCSCSNGTSFAFISYLRIGEIL